MVCSWEGQLRRTGPRISRSGFGIDVSDGHESIDMRFGQVYQKLVKYGLPVSFMTSTDGLKEWHDKQPLVLVDGYNYTPEEIKHVTQLNKNGAPIIAIGGYEDLGINHQAAADFFGVDYNDGKFTPHTDVKRINLTAGEEMFLRKASGKAGDIVYCPYDGKDLKALAAQALVREILNILGSPISVPDNLYVTTFINNGALWLALCDQSDRDRNVTVSVKPEWFLAELKGKKLAAIDMDNNQELKHSVKNGEITFTLPFAASSGRMIMLYPTE
jgi:hypothetical protein